MKELELNVEKMMCEGCENRVKNALGEISGVEKVEANHKTGKVNILLSKDVNEEEIKNLIVDLGYMIK